MSEVLMFRAVFIRVRDKSGVLANVPATVACVDKNEASWLDPVSGRPGRPDFHTVKRIAASQTPRAGRNNLHRVP